MINTSNMLKDSFDLLKWNNLLPCSSNQSGILQASLSIITLLLVDCVGLKRYKACLFFFCWFLNQYQYNANSESIFIVCSFISRAWHCIINAVLNFVRTAITSTAAVQNKYWMWSSESNNLWSTSQVYFMGCVKRHIGSLFSCFRGVWCAFLGLSASLWLCWWGPLWQTPASVPALKRGQWWAHLLQLLQHSCNCKRCWVIFQPGELQYQCGLSGDTHAKSGRN